jgi:adenosylcobinamide kinase/adenosylcobinamide-phosphate guanylyltransferase
LIFVSNEVGLGVSPMSAEARRFVDALGLLHQRIGALCESVTLMVAGVECPIKRSAA